MIPDSSDALCTAPSRVAGGSGQWILLAEDDAALRQMAARMLRSGGYYVVEAANGEEALQHWGEHSGRIDMLITDIVMPNVGGLELACSLRARDPGIHVIYMSGYSEATIKMRGTLLVDAPWMSKPFSLRDFLREVRRCFDAVPATAPVVRD